MDKLRVAVIGYGNVGRFTVEAVLAADDMELAGVVRRASSLKNDRLDIADIEFVSDIAYLGKVDVAILCCPSRLVPEMAKYYLRKGICTVDCFDIHPDIYDVHEKLNDVAKQNKTASILAAGWDPGTDSVIRSLFMAMAPKGLTYTNFGPGMSMGHSVVAKSKKGVKNALSMTIPCGAGVHRRMVYVELEKGYTSRLIYDEIKADSYFSDDELSVISVPSVEGCRDMGHAVLMERKGVSGKTQNQRFKFEMNINNPALTGQIMVACARAVVKQRFGCYVMPEVPPMDYLPGNREELIKILV